MTRWSPERWAEVEAAIRHGAANGLTWRQVGEQVGLTRTHITVLACRMGVRGAHTHRHHDAAGYQAIRDGYAAGIPPKQIAEQTGYTYGSVLKLAHDLGVTRSRHDYRDSWLYSRGFEVPKELRTEYEFLTRQKRVDRREAARMLGLLKEKEAGGG